MNSTITKLEPFSSDTIYSGSIENAENAISDVICHLASLETDLDFFKHSLPNHICDAVCCSLTAEIAAGSPGVRSFTCWIVGRGSSDNSSIFSKLRNLFNYAGEPLFLKTSHPGNAEPAVIQCFVPLDGWQKQMAAFGGVKVPRITWHLRFDIMCAG